MSTTQTQQPDALRLADVLEKMTGYDWNKTYCEAAFQLRHIQHQNECLTAENEAVQDAVSDAVAAEREACAKACESSANGFGEETLWAAGYVQGILDVASGIRARGTP